MPTIPKQYQVGEWYHVYNRGNRKQPIFLKSYDYQRFLKHYVQYAKDHSVTTFAYCLMTNHFHFLVQLNEEDAITKLFGRLSTSHAKYFNLRYELTGSLFQQGFKAKRIESESHLLHLSRYIHRNPIDTLGSTLRVEPEDILQQLIGYEWSSLSQYLGRVVAVDHPACAVADFQEIIGGDENKYRQFLLDEIELYLRKREDELQGEPLGLNLGKE